MKKSLLIIVCTLFFVAAVAVVPTLATNNGVDEKPIWLVVTRPIFVEAVRPLAEIRSKDGFKTVISTQLVADAITSLKRRPAFLLLVGDDESGKEKLPWYVQSKRRKLYRWRAVQRKSFASDTVWGDFDDDLIPDIPVGRIPARTPQQLKLIVNKIITFERKQPTLDDLRLPIWAGTPGYNQMFNMIATELMLNTVRMNASLWLRPWIISADSMHSLCGWPFDQPVIFTKQLKRGGAMALLMGHGSSECFYSMVFQNKQIGYVSTHFKDMLATGEPAPPTVIIACSTGNFTAARNCLAESLLLMPAGPVAVIGATAESHPLTNYFSGLCLIQELGEKDKRLGSIWLAAQRKAIKARNLIIERMLINIEGKLEEKINVAKLRRDQILMYALLGDPATRLHLPGELNAKINRISDSWEWEVDKPKSATTLYVSLRPDRQNFPNVKLPLEKAGARKRFEEANSTFAFRQFSELSVNEAWKGTIREEGILRLVTIGPSQIYAVAFKLKCPDTSLDKSKSDKQALQR